MKNRVLQTYPKPLENESHPDLDGSEKKFRNYALNSSSLSQVASSSVW
jgi:hypothetical protein